ncbi:sulfatase-like hydrolase/transferase [Nocardioides allogilvus]|uniref:sulfatase-like hydrolase/transferase n=1 Tax=Nocardioides allogilvus TaxID=2072017 RepID=UPI0013007558|nr:sulfatase-like hydrolase/transferase [Nocardioides allogilvus]
MPQSLRLSLTAGAGLLFLALIAAIAVSGQTPIGPEQVVNSSATSRVAASDAPNVVVFLTDDMRKDDLAYLPHVRSLLADEGMTFTQAQSPHPLCCPARAELMTGQYAQNNGVRHNSGRYGGWQAFDPSSTIATWAEAAGYATALHGKHLNKFDADAPADPGWTNFDILLEPATDYENFTFFDGDTYTDDYVTTRLDERTVADIDTWAGRRPFLIFANHVAPHIWFPASAKGDGDGDRGGMVPPAEAAYAQALTGLTPKAFKAPSFNEADMRDKESIVRGRAKLKPEAMRRLNLGRIRSLLSVDEAVRHTVEALERTGELDDTFIVFTSDNGYALGEHRYTGKDRLTDEILDVPLVVRGPGVPAGTRSDRPVSLVDLTTTIAQLMSLTPTLTTDGESFAATLRDPAVPGHRDTMLIQTGAKDPSARFAGWAYRGVLTERYSYGRRINNAPADGFLYDRTKDPFELTNLLLDKRYVAVRRELERRYRLLDDCAGSSCNRGFGPVPKPGR